MIRYTSDVKALLKKFFLDYQAQIGIEKTKIGGAITLQPVFLLLHKQLKNDLEIYLEQTVITALNSS